MCWHHIPLALPRTCQTNETHTYPLAQPCGGLRLCTPHLPSALASLPRLPPVHCATCKALGFSPGSMAGDVRWAWGCVGRAGSGRCRSRMVPRRMAIWRTPTCRHACAAAVDRLTNESVGRSKRRVGFPLHPAFSRHSAQSRDTHQAHHPLIADADLRAGLRPGPTGLCPRPELAARPLLGGPAAPAAMQDDGGEAGAEHGCGGRHVGRGAGTPPAAAAAGTV